MLVTTSSMIASAVAMMIIHDEPSIVIALGAPGAYPKRTASPVTAIAAYRLIPAAYASAIPCTSVTRLFMALLHQQLPANTQSHPTNGQQPKTSLAVSKKLLAGGDWL